MRLSLIASIIAIFTFPLWTSDETFGDFDYFGTGANQFAIHFTTIGDPGNPNDTVGKPVPVGRVDYEYRISTTEISRDMVAKATAGGLQRVNMFDLSGRGGNDPNRPATGISFFEAVDFVNWLNVSQGYQRAYNVQLGILYSWTPSEALNVGRYNLLRHRDAKYWLPNVDEWYKAAYYSSVTQSYSLFPSSDLTPPTPVASGNAFNTAVYAQPLDKGPATVFDAGGPSAYGVIGMGGNAWEWQETDIDLINDYPYSRRILRGGSWVSQLSTLRSDTWSELTYPENEGSDIGFRIASSSTVAVPEPGVIGLLPILFLGAVSHRLRCFWLRCLPRGIFERNGVQQRGKNSLK